MTRYSVKSGDVIFVNSYEFLSLVENIDKNIGNNIIKSLSGKYSKKLLHHAK